MKYSNVTHIPRVQFVLNRIRPLQHVASKWYIVLVHHAADMGNTMRHTEATNSASLQMLAWCRVCACFFAAGRAQAAGA